ncbi:MAG TPA: peptide chain release factor 2 [Clostridia bacterium]|nr:peptide chain release factor 2 [Clostridia bacterium]
MSGQQEELKRLEQIMVEPHFWDNSSTAKQITQQATMLKNQIEEYTNLQKKIEDVEVLYEFGQKEEEYLGEAEKVLQQVIKDLDALELQLLFQGKYDASNVILSLHAGAGGTESQDWTNMLLRMYTRWAEQQGFGVEMLDYLAGDEAGVKNVTLLIKGENAYGLLKAEKGVHRLVRISPFDASGRRHTSFAAVDVLPEVDDADAEIVLHSEEIKVDTYRASGAGGQHVNKTDSAVRMTHLPTGIVVQCQNERSQNANRNACEKILKARLLELKRREQEEEIESLRGELGEIGWGNQIRSYVFHPYSMVKDHRTDIEIGDVNRVMDGELDPFIDAYLRMKATQKQ